MKIKIDKYKETVEEEIKKLAKENGVKIKDIGECILTGHHWGIGLVIFDKNGKCITNCAM